MPLNEAAFMDAATQFLLNLRGPDQGTVEPDSDLVLDSGLDSLQLIALFRFIEELRGDELPDVPELENLTLRGSYQLLYRGKPVTN